MVAVDEHEVEFSFVENASGFDGWQAQRMPTTGVDSQVPQRNRQISVKRLVGDNLRKRSKCEARVLVKQNVSFR